MYVKEKQARETHLHIHKSQMTEHRGGSFFPHNYLITHTFTSCSQSKTDLINVPSPSVSEPSHLCPSSPGMIQYLVHWWSPKTVLLKTDQLLHSNKKKVATLLI